MNKSKKGFTLAELLLTLLIIGVVASLVIPVILNDVKDAEFNVGIKNVMADLSRAINMIQIRNGGNVAVGIGDAATDSAAFRNEFCNVMLCTKVNTDANIFDGITYKWYKGTIAGTYNTNTDSAAGLSNGTLLNFFASSGCDNWSINGCGYIDVDINNRKGPNMWGKDLYRFYVVRKNGTGVYSILPAGAQNETNDPYCTIGTGAGCTVIRLINPGEMQ